MQVFVWKTGLSGPWCGVACLAALCFATAGCNRSPYEMARVVGTVTIDGEPLRGGQVQFAPISRGQDSEAGKPALGTVRPDGSFELSTYKEGDGAVVGHHFVTVFGPEDSTLLPGGIAPFERLAVQGDAVEIRSGDDNEINIELAASDFKRKKMRRDPPKRKSK